MDRVREQVARLVIIAAVVVATASCEKRGAPKQTPSKEPAPAPKTSEEARDRVNVLKLAEFAAFDQLSVPAAITPALKPGEGWRLWNQLRKQYASLGLLAIVVDDELIGESWSPNDEPPDRAKERKQAAALTAQEFFRRRRIGWAERRYLAKSVGLAEDSWTDLDFAEFAKRCREAGVDYCPEKDYDHETLAQLDDIGPELLGGEERTEPLYVSQNERWAKIGLKKELSVRVMVIATTFRDLPIELSIGGWNAMPSPHEHAVVIEAWRQRYGAEMAYYSGDIVELVIERPPRNVAQLREVTKQHFLYCTDIVHQGTDTLPALANALGADRTWYFWWD